MVTDARLALCTRSQGFAVDFFFVARTVRAVFSSLCSQRLFFAGFMYVPCCWCRYPHPLQRCEVSQLGGHGGIATQLLGGARARRYFSFYR